MKKFLQRRVLPLILAISLCFSFMVIPSNAFLAEASGILDVVMKGYQAIKSTVSGLQFLEDLIYSTSPTTNTEEIYRPLVLADMPSNGAYISLADLQSLNLQFKGNGTFNDDMYETYVSTFDGSDGVTYCGIEVRPRYRLTKDDGTELNQQRRVFVAYQGHILYADYDYTADDKEHENGIWLTYSSLPTHRLISLDFLTKARKFQRDHGYEDCDIVKMAEGYVLTYSTGTAPYGVRYVYCSPDGYAYVAPAGDREVENDRVHVDVNNNEINVGIDLENGIINLPDGIEMELLQTIYDDSTKTYYIDARQYSEDNDTYITYNYSWTYHIDYTSITYIGQTEEYNKYYEVYYELPDGRSSADLTAEELEQLNVSMDVLPYIRSADDVSVRALYHFDGDIRDSSYWNYAGELTWNKGASITYMDAGVFEGALYLDENEHDFSVKLPSNLASSDFTIQFRYYQSHTEAPVTDSSITLGSLVLASFDGESIIFNGTSYPISVGNWQELCFMRSGNTLYCFHNGVLLGSMTVSGSYGDTLNFVFGTEQQTFKYFDELRVVSKAVYDTAGYTPTAVPFDTNLALVLPDSKLPVADAYWSIQSSGTNILSQYGLDNWLEVALTEHDYLHAKRFNDESSAGYTLTLALNPNTQGWYIRAYNSSNGVQLMTNLASLAYSDAYFCFPNFNYFNASAVSDASGLTITNDFIPSQNANQPYPDGNSNYYSNYMVSGALSGAGWVPYGGLITVLAYNQGSINNPSGTAMQGNLVFDQDYTFSIVLDDGSVHSVTFNLSDLELGKPDSGNLTHVFAETDNTVFGVALSGNANNSYLGYWLAVMPKDISNGGKTDTIVYMEMVEGTSTDLTAEYVESVVVMDKDDLNTPSLAVKTDLEITGHQIGGMRPSVPSKGLVWALVEGGVIKSLQIYNGSAWEAVDGRIWTGSRWVPYSAYNVLLMKDLYDIDGVVTPDDYEYIYTEEGFWSWWQKSWNSFVSWLQGKDNSSSDQSGNDDVSDDVLPPVEEEEEGETWTFLDLLGGLKDGLWSISKGITTTVFDGVNGIVVAITSIGDYFTVFQTDGGVFQIYDGGVDVWA